MRRKTAIGVMAITVVAMPAALFALATVAMWPNSTFEELLFQKVDGQMITPKDVLHRLNAEVRWPRLFGQFFRFDEWSLCRG